MGPMAGATDAGASVSRHDGFNGARDARLIDEYVVEGLATEEPFVMMQVVPATMDLLVRAGFARRLLRRCEFARVPVRWDAYRDRWEVAVEEETGADEFSGPASVGAGTAGGAGAIGGEGLKKPCLDASPPPSAGAFLVEGGAEA